MRKFFQGKKNIRDFSFFTSTFSSNSYVLRPKKFYQQSFGRYEDSPYLCRMKHIFIVNPHAGAHSCEAAVREALRLFDGQVDYDIYVKQWRGDSHDVVRRYRADCPDEPLRFYACGGDGTLRELAIACIGIERVAFTAFAHGSGNDYVKYYGGPDQFRDVARLIHGAETPIDMMKVNTSSDVTWAMNATHFGLDARVAAAMDSLRRVPLIGKSMAYPTGVAWGFLTGMNNPCTVWADGQRISLSPAPPKGRETKKSFPSGEDLGEARSYDRILLCTAANGTHVGGSYCCAPRSQNDDGLMEVCLVRPLPRLKFLRLMDGYKRGTHLDDPRFAPHITYCRARTLTIEGPEGFCVSLDGELLHATHIEVENIPHAVTFIKPAEGKNRFARN